MFDYRIKHNPLDYDKTKPLLWECPFGYFDEDCLSFEKEDNVVDQKQFYTRNKIETELKGLVFRTKLNAKKLRKMDIIPCTFPGEVVNKKVLDIFNRICPNDIQSFPVVIKNMGTKKKPGYTVEGYYLIHVVKFVDVIDYGRSEVWLYDENLPAKRGNIGGIERVRYNANCMGNSHIAGDTIFGAHTVISHALFDELLKENVTGAEFSQISFVTMREVVVIGNCED